MNYPELKNLPLPSNNKKGWPWTEYSEPSVESMPTGFIWPRISIVTPSYNQAEFLEETIRSVLLQGYHNLEYIIIDGGSTDSSAEIIRKYEKWLTFWVSEPDRGQSHAINKGFEKASGEIFSWLNSDDYFQKNALKNVAFAYNKSPNAGGWFGGCMRMKEHGSFIEVRWPNRLDKEEFADVHKNWVMQPACFFSKKAWKGCGPLDEDMHFAMDFDLWMKILKYFKFEKINNLLAFARIYKDAKSQYGRGQMFAELCSIQIRDGYARFALNDIANWMNSYFTIKRKIERISDLPFLRPFFPAIKFIWRKLK